jgi:hypothetical protein
MSWANIHRSAWSILALQAALLFGIVWLAVGFATTNILAIDLWRGLSYWPLVRLCGVGFLVCILLFWIFGRSVAPLLVAVGVLALAAFGPAAVLASAALLWVAYILGELIVRHSRPDVDEPALFLLRLALGLIVVDLILNVAIALPVHDVRIYTFVFLAAVGLRWRTSAGLMREIGVLWHACRRPLDFWSSLGAIAAAVLVSVQVVLAALPERQFDALAVHLSVAQTVATAGQWHFAGDFAVPYSQSLGADWIFSVVFVLAGENGAKVMNYVFFLLGAGIVHALSVQRFGRGPATAGTLVLLSSPIAFLEAAGVSSDNFLLLGITATVAVCGIWERLSPRERVLSSAVLLGGLPSAKLHGVLVQLALVAVLLSRRIWSDVRFAGARTGIAGLVLVALGAVPFLIAFAVTGNPIFPFFNAVFKSPYFPIWNFIHYPPDIAPDIIHRLTFHTSKFIEGWDGSFGFQFVAFLFFCLLSAFVRTSSLVISALFVTVSYVVGILLMSTYARYIYPIFPAFSILIAAGIFLLRENGARRSAVAAIALAVIVTGLNFRYFPAARWSLLPFSVTPLIDTAARDRMIEGAVPHRLLLDHLDGAHGTRARVVFVGQPFGFPLLGTPIFTDWYMPTVAKGMAEARTNDDVRRWLTSVGATHLIMGTSEATTNVETLRKYFASEGDPVMTVNRVILYRIADDVRFATVLSRTGSWDNWALGAAEVSSRGVRIVPGTEPSFSTRQFASGERQVRVSARAACDGNSGEVVVRIFWHGPKARMGSSAVPCASEGGRLSAIFDRPRGATAATIALVKGGAGAAYVGEVSVTTTAITLAEPLPLFRRDWINSPVWSKLPRALAPGAISK